MTDHHEDCVPVELRPFQHQVGGHTCVLEIDQSTICKPYIDREVWFYEHAPQELADFIPKYLGETFVTCDFQQNRKYLVAMVPRDIATRDGLVDSGKRSHKGETSSSKKRRKRTRDKDAHVDISNRESNDKLTSWSNQCIDRQINRYGFWANNQPQKFIMLENLVRAYKHPCLMDLKMGRRQFGEDSDEAKRKLLASRCAGSTSATLGFRLCGSQTYKSATSSYVFHDKYFGRQLSDTGAKQEINHFFHNGDRLRVDVIKRILDKISDLREVLMSNVNLFFHSASLLILYDGELPTNSSLKDTFNIPETEVTPSSTEVLSAHVQSNTPSVVPQSCNVQSLERTNQTNADRLADQSSDSCVHEDIPSVSGNLNRCSPDSPNDAFVPQVDIRMIDFAHVSENQTNVEDHSIMFGLNKLKDVLEEMLLDDPSRFEEKVNYQ